MPKGGGLKFMNTETFWSFLLPNLGLVLYVLVAVWKRKETWSRLFVAGGVFFTLNIGSWGFVTRHLLAESDILHEGYGDLLTSFYLNWYFVYFYLAILLAFGFLMLSKRRKSSENE